MADWKLGYQGLKKGAICEIGGQKSLEIGGKKTWDMGNWVPCATPLYKV